MLGVQQEISIRQSLSNSLEYPLCPWISSKKDGKFSLADKNNGILNKEFFNEIQPSYFACTLSFFLKLLNYFYIAF